MYSYLNNGKVINRYPNIKGLGRKDWFEQMMELGRNISEDTFNFVPPSFIFPRDLKKFKEYHKKNKDAVFIAKPESGS